MFYFTHQTCADQHIIDMLVSGLHIVIVYLCFNGKFKIKDFEFSVKT